MDMIFGTWKVRSLYRAGSLKTVARELGKHNLYLVNIQVVRREKGGTEQAELHFLWRREIRSSVKDRFFHT
jgi:hypothetical protein